MNIRRWPSPTTPNIEIDRDDIPDVHKHGVPVKPAFEINGNLCFKPGELNPAIDTMIKHGLV